MKQFLFMNRLLFVITVLWFLTGNNNSCWGQVTLYSQNFGTTTTYPAGWSSSSTDWQNSNVNSSSGYSGASGGSNAWFQNNNTTPQTLTYSNNLSTVGYENISVLWGARLTPLVAITVVLSWSSDGSTWNNVSFTNVTNNSVWALVNGGTQISLPAGAAGIANLRLRWTATAASGTNNTSYRIDDLTVQGDCKSYSATISYSGTPFCKTESSPQAVTRTGSAGGTYSSTAGLSINASTGAITPSTSTAATYTVTYTIAGAAGCSNYSTTTNVTVSAALVISQIPVSNIILNYKFSGNANDEAGTNNGTLQNSPALAADRFGIANKAYTFNGSSQFVSTANSYTNPANITVSIWFKTATTTGGLLIGFGNSQTGSSTSYDRHIYMNNAGQIYFGVYAGAIVAINSTLSYNDNNWHQASATMSSTTGIALYIDGVQVATNGTATYGDGLTGWWRIGYDNIRWWPSEPSSYYFNGTLDDALVYHTTLNATQIATIYNSPDGAGNNGPLCSGNTLNLTATTVSGASYAWTGPNSFTSASQNPSFIYSTAYAGVYTVTVNSGGCAATAYTKVTTAVSGSTISYSGSPYCSNAGTATVSFSGTSGGTYSSTAGLFVNASTGAVTLGTSTAGTYTVTYTEPGGCTATTSITVTAPPAATISYAGTPFCISLGSGQPVTQTGTTGGTYSSTSGLTIHASTGAITPATSTAGTYTVTYTIAASGGCSIFTTTTSVTISAVPNISQIPASTILNYKFSGNANDESGTNNGTLQNSPALATDRFIISNKAYTFNGSSQYVSTANSYANPTNYTVSIWFKTGTTTGGKLIGFGNTQTGAGTTFDRHIYMNNAGQIYFGAYAGSAVTVNSPLTYNDNNWHLATATMSSTAGMVLYIDGIQVASNANTTSQNYTGYWRIGYGNLTTWPSLPASFYFNGTLDDALVYHTALNATQVATLYNSPDGAGNNGPLCSGRTLNLTATTVSGASYAWTGPNSFTSASQNPSFIYSSAYAGVYTVMVTSGGCAATAYTQVTTTATGSTISYTGTPYCSNAGTASVTLTGTAGGTYSSSVGLSINSSTGAVTLGTSTAGTYTVVYTEPGGCTTTTGIIVTALPSPTISYAGTPFCISLGSGQPVTQTGTTGGTYSSTAGLTINASTGAITPATSTAGNYTVTYTIAAAGGCGIVTTTCLISIITDLVWTGTLSTNWNATGNWSCGYLPNSTTSVQIPNVANKPILSTGATGAVNNLVIDNGSSLTVSGNTIQIYGSITNNGSFSAASGIISMNGTAAQIIGNNVFTGNTIQDLIINNPSGVTLQGPLNITGIVAAQNGNLSSGGNLTLLSTAAQTALINGSGSGNVTGNVTMQRYLSSGFGYKYFSSPFQAATVNEFGDDMNLAATFPSVYSYDENRTSSGWVSYINPVNILNPLHGYTFNFGAINSPNTVDITGVVNNGNLSVTLFNHNNTYTRGFNLVGNPYPSPVDWNAAGWTKNNIDNALYYFKASTSDQYGGTYSTYINSISSDGIVNNIIPSMQGFFIHVSDGSYPISGILATSNTIRITDLTHYFTKSKGSFSVPILRLTAGFSDDAASFDPAVIYFDEKATPDFDNQLDALKLFNTDLNVANLYAVNPDGGKLSIRGIPPISENFCRVPLGIKLNRSGNIIFRIQDIDETLMGMRIYLSDITAGIDMDLLPDKEYSLYLSSGEYINRFFLNLSVITTDIQDTRSQKDLFSIYSTHGILKTEIYEISMTEGTLEIFSLTGKINFIKKVYNIGYYELNPGLKEGIYIIRYTTGTKMSSKKLFIQNR